MAKRTKGFRRRTRNKMKKSPRDKGTVNQFLEDFNEGEKVLIRIDPSSHRAMPHPRFKGRSGVVTGKRGRSYLVEIRDGSLKKTLITTSEHLRHINKRK
ncbi:MAG: 50S ribosomal protein L21e [archaeon]|nr:MAG: 50S ribosomal protein L21e [archaeon]